ncbi:hypothetical protein M3J09_010146 [Ascochyta lentis]
MFRIRVRLSDAERQGTTTRGFSLWIQPNVLQNKNINPLVSKPKEEKPTTLVGPERERLRKCQAHHARTNNI